MPAEGAAERRCQSGESESPGSTDRRCTNTNDFNPAGRHEIASREACVGVSCYRRVVASRSDRRASRRASAFSRRQSSVSRAPISRAWIVISSVAARTRARLSRVRGKRTVVCAIGSGSTNLCRDGMGPPVCWKLASGSPRPLTAKVTANVAPATCISSRPNCCDEATNIACLLTDHPPRRTLVSPIQLSDAGGPAVDDPCTIGTWVGPRGGRFCFRALNGYRSVSVKIEGGSRHGTCGS
jgi:hypothetical protein